MNDGNLRHILSLLHATMMLQNVNCAMFASTRFVRKVSVLKPLVAGHLTLLNRLYFCVKLHSSNDNASYSLKVCISYDI